MTVFTKPSALLSSTLRYELVLVGPVDLKIHNLNL